jgi:hypothetical protein
MILQAGPEDFWLLVLTAGPEDCVCVGWDPNDWCCFRPDLKTLMR